MIVRERLGPSGHAIMKRAQSMRPKSVQFGGRNPVQEKLIGRSSSQGIFPSSGSAFGVGGPAL